VGKENLQSLENQFIEGVDLLKTRPNQGANPKVKDEVKLRRIYARDLILFDSCFNKLARSSQTSTFFYFMEQGRV